MSETIKVARSDGLAGLARALRTAPLGATVEVYSEEALELARVAVGPGRRNRPDLCLRLDTDDVLRLSREGWHAELSRVLSSAPREAEVLAPFPSACVTATKVARDLGRADLRFRVEETTHQQPHG